MLARRDTQDAGRSSAAGAAVQLSAQVGGEQKEATTARFYSPPSLPPRSPFGLSFLEMAKSLWLMGMCRLSVQRGDDLEQKDRRLRWEMWQV